MPALNDDCLLLIFERLNLNERTNVRLACKRFRALCDQIKIQKLVIYQRETPRAGRLQQTNEPYGLEHTAYVVHLQKLFSDKRIVGQMQTLRALVIHGDYQPECPEEVILKVKFEQLNYLELHRCAFTSPILLASSQLEYLVVDYIHMLPASVIAAKESEINRRGGGDSWVWYSLGLGELKSQRLKYFSVITYCFDATVTQKVLKTHLFDRLEVAEVCLAFWIFIGFFARKELCPKLRSLDVLIELPAGAPFEMTVQQILNSMDEEDLNEFFSAFNEHLTVHLYGLSFSRPQHKTVLAEFFRPFGRKIRVDSGRFELRMDRPIYEHIKSWHEKWGEKRSLDRFYETVGQLTLFGCDEQVNADPAFFRRFSRCDSIDAIPKSADLDRYLEPFVNLRRIAIRSEFDDPLNEGQLSSIVEKHPQLQILNFESWNEIDLSCLFKLKHLRILRFRMAVAPAQSTLIELLKNLRDLTKLEICFLRTGGGNKSELNELKKTVNKTFSTRFKSRALEFVAEVHTKAADQFVRYLLRAVHDHKQMHKCDKERMFNFIDHQEAPARSEGVQGAVRSACDRWQALVRTGQRSRSSLTSSFD